MHFKFQIQIALIALSIATTSICDLVPALDPLGTTTFPGYNIYSVNWCGCNYLAAAGDIDIAGTQYGIVGIYQFDQPTQTLSLTVTATVTCDSFAAKWCPSCNYLAVGFENDCSDRNFKANNPPVSVGIQIFSFYPQIPALQPLGEPTAFDGGFIYSLDWCPSSCTYLAAGGSVYVPASGLIQVYTFSQNTGLAPIGAAVYPPNFIYSIKWGCDCRYLAAVDSANTLYIYNFNSDGLSTAASWVGTTSYNSVDWCGECGYIAVGGQSNVFPFHGIIDIYKFDSTSTQSISLITSATIPAANSSAVSVAWCQDCDNLAVDVNIRGATCVQLYHFDSSTETLSVPQTYISTLANQSFGAIIDWCGNCCNYLAVGGVFQQTFPLAPVGAIELFKGNAICLTAPNNLTAQKIFHRFPTQVDIINQICWSAAPGAVAYNVYADAALSILLATITNPQLCYSQHQIRSGTSSTYYVTAVDANGFESQPAVVTI